MLKLRRVLVQLTIPSCPGEGVDIIAKLVEAMKYEVANITPS